MGWFILIHVFTTWMSIVSIGRLSEQEKELEILGVTPATGHSPTQMR